MARKTPISSRRDLGRAARNKDETTVCTCCPQIRQAFERRVQNYNTIRLQRNSNALTPTVMPLFRSRLAMRCLVGRRAFKVQWAPRLLDLSPPFAGTRRAELALGGRRRSEAKSPGAGPGTASVAAEGLSGRKTYDRMDCNDLKRSASPLTRNPRCARISSSKSELRSSRPRKERLSYAHIFTGRCA